MLDQSFLAGVAKPARYLGGEHGVVLKDPEKVRLWFALAFPEIYELAMSHLGIKILYQALAGREDVAAERVFMPWKDLMDILAERGEAPWSLESGRALNDFDAIGFSLQYELTYTNALHMLRLAGIPLRREDRGPFDPVILAGGPCLVNPEPMADFLDLAVVGEAEEILDPLMDLLLESKEQGWERNRLYERAAKIRGVYAPALYHAQYEGGRIKSIKAAPGAPPKVKRRVVSDLREFPLPLDQVAPSVRAVHDRLGLEIARGCTRGCRFCQAGYIYRPVRERGASDLVDAALKGLDLTGFDELALLSLSTGDHSCIAELAAALMDLLQARRVGVSLPSLRVESLTTELAEQVKRVRKTGFTLAPEAGSDRMRRVINKGFTEEDILATAKRVFGLGWNLIKLYFMLGLPTETDEDITAIAGLAGRVAELSGKGRGKKPVVNASLGIFVPKPHTPFQWEGQPDLEEASRRLALAKSAPIHPKVQIKWNSPRQSILEGVLSRGDRRLSKALEIALERGCRFDGWTEEFQLETWMEALSEAGLSAGEYLRPRSEDEILPWDHIDIGVSKEYLLRERARALAERSTADCRNGACQGCGVCDFKSIKPVLAETPPRPADTAFEPEGEPVAYRFRLEKTGPARFLGHLETMTQIERSFRRAKAPLVFSQGFHPHAQVKAQSALPLGVESLVETLEVKLTRAEDPDRLAEAVNKVLPAGLKLADGRRRLPGENLAEPDLVSYRITNAPGLEQARLDEFAGLESLMYERVTPKGRKVMDLKKTVKAIELADGGLSVTVGRDGGRPKPAELLRGIFRLDRDAALGARALKVSAEILEG